VIICNIADISDGIPANPDPKLGGNSAEEFRQSRTWAPLVATLPREILICAESCVCGAAGHVVKGDVHGGFALEARPAEDGVSGGNSLIVRRSGIFTKEISAPPRARWRGI